MKIKLFLIVGAALLLACSCSPGLNLHTAPDKQLTEDNIILKGFLQKDHHLDFSILKDKPKRRKYLTAINKLAAEGLSLFKAGKMPSDNYIEFSTAVTTFGDLLWRFADAEHNSSLVSDEWLEKIKENSKLAIDKVKANSLQKDVLAEGQKQDDKFVLACSLIIFVMNGYLEQFRH